MQNACVEEAIPLYDIKKMYLIHLRPSLKKTFLVRISLKKRAGGFFGYLLFPIACFLFTLLPYPRDTLEL